METFITLTHILVALILIALVLVQDTKSGSLGGAFGGGGSNSVFGATGATTLAQKITRYTAIVFAATSIALSVLATKSHKSLMDSAPVAPAAQTAPADTTTPAAQPAAPTQQAPAQPTEGQPNK